MRRKWATTGSTPQDSKKGGLNELIPLIAGERGRDAWISGDVDGAPMYVGQSIGLINDILICAELLERMMAEAREQVRKLSSRM